MELHDFIGMHILTGCQYGAMAGDNHFGEIANTIDFILDDRVFSAIENPEDGYRSAMEEIIENRTGLNITNTFTPCEVLGVFRANDKYEENDIVDFYDIKTGKIVLSIGTGNTNDYYPYFVGSFSPENMASNIPESAGKTPSNIEEGQ